MEPLASLEELEEFVGEEFGPIDPGEGRLKLELASGEVRAYCGQEFTPQTDDEVVLDGTGTRVLMLPELPVLDVSLVEEGIGGARSSLPGPGDRGAVWEWSSDGILRMVHARDVWARRFRFYRVLYSHGFEPIPDALKAIVLKVSARSLDDPAGQFRSETLGRYSYTLAGAEAGVGLTRADERTLERGGFVIGSRPRSVPSSSSGSGSGS